MCDRVVVVCPYCIAATLLVRIIMLAAPDSSKLAIVVDFLKYASYCAQLAPVESGSLTRMQA